MRNMPAIPSSSLLLAAIMLVVACLINFSTPAAAVIADNTTTTSTCYAGISQPNSYAYAWGKYEIPRQENGRIPQFTLLFSEHDTNVFAKSVFQQGLLSRTGHELHSIVQNDYTTATALAIIPTNTSYGVPFLVNLELYLYSYPILGFGHYVTEYQNSTLVLGRQRIWPHAFTILKITNHTSISQLPFQDTSGGIASGDLFPGTSTFDNRRNLWWMLGNFDASEKNDASDKKANQDTVFVYAVDAETAAKRMRIGTQAYKILTLDYLPGQDSILALAVSQNQQDLQIFSLLRIRPQDGHWDCIYVFEDIENAFSGVSGVDTQAGILYLVLKRQQDAGFRIFGINGSLPNPGIVMGGLCGSVCPLALVCR